MLQQWWKQLSFLDKGAKKRSPGILGQLGSSDHVHFLERQLSRRRFLLTAGGATGLALGSGLWPSARALAGSKLVDPKPIPGGLQPLGDGTELFHFFLPELGNEPSTITDFSGFVAIARIQGTGTGTDAETGKDIDLLFDADMRFMSGEYIGVDGRRHRGTFALV